MERGRYFVTGRGSVGKTTVARMLAALYPDAVRIDLEHRQGFPGAEHHAIKEEADCVMLHGLMDKLKEETTVVINFPDFWSITNEKVRRLLLESMEFAGVRPVWVIGAHDMNMLELSGLKSQYPVMRQGIVAINRFFDVSKYWSSEDRKGVLADEDWREVHVPAMSPSMLENMDTKNLLTGFVLRVFQERLEQHG